MSSTPRILSLLPSATEIAVALGLGEQLVGRSHECDFPAWVRQLPPCSSTKLEKGLTSREIDDRVQEIVRQGLSVYEVDAELVRDLKADLILTQSQCAVCAVTPRDLEEALHAWVGAAPTLLSLAPDTLDDVWNDILRVGDLAGVPSSAEQLVARLDDGLKAVRDRPSGRLDRPTVAAVEWIDPLMAAGNWIPELVDAAGGRPLFLDRGAHSSWLSFDALVEEDPDFIILMPCGYTISQSLADLRPLTERAGWRDLRAVRNHRVFICDGHHFFNRPGPRLVESANMIAEILDAPSEMNVGTTGAWVRVTPDLHRSAQP